MIFSEVTEYSLLIDAGLTIFIAILFLLKTRGNPIVFLPAFFIFYNIYSIVIAEYFVKGELGVPFQLVKTVEIYGVTIRTLLIFIVILFLFYKKIKISKSDFGIKTKDNILLFVSILTILVAVMIFGMDRSIMTGYSVRITSFYEYSVILFLLGYYFAGESKVRKYILITIALLFILQDFYYGGRITSLQIIFLLLATYFTKYLKPRFIFVIGFIGITVNSLIGLYRQKYSFNNLNLLEIMEGLKNKYFVFETPVYAYYASATHVAATPLASLTERLNSFISFLGSIVMGSINEISNVTLYVKNYYFYNMGGGVLTTHFYFWGGMFGVILISFLIVFIFNNIATLKNDYLKLCGIMIVANTPRWFLYTPLIMFRSLFLLSVLFILLMFAHKIMVGAVSKKSITIKAPIKLTKNEI